MAWTGLDGLGICRKIRQNDNTPIIMLIAVDDYIEKPYDIDILLAKIKGIFKHRKITPDVPRGTSGLALS